jgi:hypothetical protein
LALLDLVLLDLALLALLALLDLLLLALVHLASVLPVLRMATMALQEAGHGVLVAAAESVDPVLPAASVAAPIVHWLRVSETRRARMLPPKSG